MSDAQEVNYLTIAQFHERHKDLMSKWLVGEMVRRGELPHIRLGEGKWARVAIPENALELMRQQQREKVA